MSTSRFSDAQARVLCYMLGPLSGAFIAAFRQYGAVWSVRFHAFHSMLMTAVWAVAWGALRLIEAISPWFVSTLAREVRYTMNLGFLILWAVLLASAYEGTRCVIVPYVHMLSVRLARKSLTHARM